MLFKEKIYWPPSLLPKKSSPGEVGDFGSSLSLDFEVEPPLRDILVLLMFKEPLLFALLNKVPFLSYLSWNSMSSVSLSVSGSINSAL